MGGSQVYKEALLRKECTRAFVTKVKANNENKDEDSRIQRECDTFFPPLLDEESTRFVRGGDERLREIFGAHAPVGTHTSQKFDYSFAIYEQKC